MPHGYGAVPATPCASPCGGKTRAYDDANDFKSARRRYRARRTAVLQSEELSAGMLGLLRSAPTSDKLVAAVSPDLPVTQLVLSLSSKLSGVEAKLDAVLATLAGDSLSVGWSPGGLVYHAGKTVVSCGVSSAMSMDAPAFHPEAGTLF